VSDGEGVTETEFTGVADFESVIDKELVSDNEIVNVNVGDNEAECVLEYVLDSVKDVLTVSECEHVVVVDGVCVRVMV
jgi:hypothetical protein